MVHEGVEHVLGRGVQAADGDWREDARLLVLVEALEEHESKLVIGTVIAIPSIDASTILECS